MLLNCDLGESYATNLIGDDAAVMPHIDQASVACGFHGGDPATIRRTIALAIAHDVAIGAHPSYPDLEGFGRRSIPLTREEIIATLHYQVAALEGMTQSAGGSLSYIKPHGALYNDMMARADVRAAVLAAIGSYHSKYTLVLQATPHWQEHLGEASLLGIELQFEAFADRRYSADGALQARDQAGAVLQQEEILKQVEELCVHGRVIAADGNSLAIHAQTLCVHGDNPDAVTAIRAIRALVNGH